MQLDDKLVVITGSGRTPALAFASPCANPALLDLNE